MAGITDLFGNQPVPRKPPNQSGFNKYSAGAKHYGGGRSFPNMGPVRNMQGYAERDNKAEAKKSAILRRMRGQMSGNAMNPDILRSPLLRGF